MIINIISYLAYTFTQSDLQLIQVSRGQSPLEQCGVKVLAQAPNSCADLVRATLVLKPPTFWGCTLATGLQADSSDDSGLISTSGKEQGTR